MRALLVVVSTLFILVSVACSKTRADVGVDALLHVDNAQFYREPIPEGGGDGPKVISSTATGRTTAGRSEQSCTGELASSATAVAVGLVGDIGYWIVPAKIPLASAPTLPTFSLVFAVSERLLPGPHELEFHAVDGQGHFGPAELRPIEVQAPTRPAGRLVISLTWENEADLDLHVVLPSGVEIFKRNRTEYQRPPASAGPILPDAPTDGGVLDRDSNANCVFDGQQAEDVVWAEAPPSGHYIVRVDTFSLCGVPSAPWRLEAVLDGVRIGAAQGTGTDYDLRFEHNRGGGLLALELDVP